MVEVQRTESVVANSAEDLSIAELIRESAKGKSACSSHQKNLFGLLISATWCPSVQSILAYICTAREVKYHTVRHWEQVEMPQPSRSVPADQQACRTDIHTNLP